MTLSSMVTRLKTGSCLGVLPLSLLSEAELFISPVIKEDSDCFRTVSFHILRIRLCEPVEYLPGVLDPEVFPEPIELSVLFPLQQCVRRHFPYSLRTFFWRTQWKMNINIPCRELNMVKRYAMMTVLSLIYMSPNAQVSPNRQSRAIAPITQDLILSRHPDSGFSMAV